MDEKSFAKKFHFKRADSCGICKYYDSRFYVECSMKKVNKLKKINTHKDMICDLFERKEGYNNV